MPIAAQISPTSASSTAPDRTSGGAWNARPSLDRRSGTSPAPHSCTITSFDFGVFPASSHAWHVPSVGWPANGSSSVGVKMRTR